MVGRAYIVVSRDQLTAKDSHYLLAKRLGELGRKVVIVDVTGGALSCYPSDSRFSAATFGAFFKEVTPDSSAPGEGDAFLLRLDPPLVAYQAALIHRTFSLARAVNRVQGLLLAHSKIVLPLNFNERKEYVVVNNDADVFRVLGQWRDIVLKPLNGFGGTGVVRVGRGGGPDILQNVTYPMIAMEFRPEIKAGERRTFVVDGKPAGALVRTPAQGSWLANAGAGASVRIVDLNDDDDAVANRATRALQLYGLRFFAVDHVAGPEGPVIIEVNVSNPGGISAVDQEDGGKLVGKIAALFD